MTSLDWCLRLEHRGWAELFSEGRWGRFRIDPRGVNGSDLVFLTGWDAGSISAVEGAIQLGGSPRIVSPQGLLERVGASRPEDDSGDAVPLDGLLVAWLPASAPTRVSVRPRGFLRRGRALTGSGPARRGPTTIEPAILELTFPWGDRLLHLGSSIHRTTSPAWLDSVVERFHGPRWVIVGAPYGEEEALAPALLRLEPEIVLLTDLDRKERALRGHPTQLLTPTVDQLCEHGLSVHPFASGATYRFE